FVNNIFNLDRRYARDIMVHRTRVCALSADDTVAHAIQMVRDKCHTRFPLYRGQDKDDVLGFVHAKDLLSEPPDKRLEPFARPALYIYDHLPVDEALEHMRRENQQFGLVWDEYGSWQGLITMEDVIEIIVGSLQDEFDHEEPRVLRRDDGSCLVDSKLSLEQIARVLRLDLGPDAEEHYRPLAALLVENFGGMPSKGDSVTLYGAQFTVAEIDGRTIIKVLVTPEANSHAKETP
ncbi:MAG: hemolysin family protein, partial [Candidatus Adiutrix sp.]|nr:hemolysin family protein [Candidatus Adiutrix sp.]